MNATPRATTDIVGDIRYLSCFADDSITAIYAAHVLEHIPHRKLLDVLKGHSADSGAVRKVLCCRTRSCCALFIAHDKGIEEKAKLMAMMFGAQSDSHDFHQAGLTST